MGNLQGGAEGRHRNASGRGAALSGERTQDAPTGAGASWVREGAATCSRGAARGSVLQRIRNLAAVLGQLAHYRPVQGQVLLGTAVCAGVDLEFGRQLLARIQAGGQR